MNLLRTVSVVLGLFACYMHSAACEETEAQGKAGDSWVERFSGLSEGVTLLLLVDLDVQSIGGEKSWKEGEFFKEVLKTSPYQSLREVALDGNKVGSAQLKKELLRVAEHYIQEKEVGPADESGHGWRPILRSQGAAAVTLLLAELDIDFESLPIVIAMHVRYQEAQQGVKEGDPTARDYVASPIEDIFHEAERRLLRRMPGNHRVRVRLTAPQEDALASILKLVYRDEEGDVDGAAFQDRRAKRYKLVQAFKRGLRSR